MYYSLALFLGAFTPFVLSTVLDSDRQHSVQDMHGNCIQLDIASLDTVKSLLSSRIADLPASASTLGADHVQLQGRRLPPAGLKTDESQALGTNFSPIQRPFPILPPFRPASALESDCDCHRPTTWSCKRSCEGVQPVPPPRFKCDCDNPTTWACKRSCQGQPPNPPVPPPESKCDCNRPTTWTCKLACGGCISPDDCNSCNCDHKSHKDHCCLVACARGSKAEHDNIPPSPKNGDSSLAHLLVQASTGLSNLVTACPSLNVYASYISVDLVESLGMAYQASIIEPQDFSQSEFPSIQLEGSAYHIVGSLELTVSWLSHKWPHWMKHTFYIVEFIDQACPSDTPTSTYCKAELNLGIELLHQMGVLEVNYDIE